MLSEQVVPAPQAVPQPPQFALSDVVLMQLPPQHVLSSPQTVLPQVQTPDTQISSMSHALPTAPQLSGSLPMSTHAKVEPLATH